MGFGPLINYHGGLIHSRNFSKLSFPSPCPAVAEVDALRLEWEELKQRLTDLEQLNERLVGALH